MQVTPSQLSTLLRAAIPARLPVLITGAPGIGKTDIVESTARELIFAQDKGGDGLPYDILVSHPVVSDPTDFKGLPFANGQSTEATFLPFGDLSIAMNAKRPLVWFFDDLGQAPQSVQAACMQLFLARKINGHHLSDFVTFVGATNRRGDRAGVGGILEPVKSRFATIVELLADLDSFSQWAIANNLPTTLIAYLRYRPDNLSNFKATADMTNSPGPRTWANLAKLEALGLPAQIQAAAFAGAVGEGAATEYTAFCRMFAKLTSVDAILADPKNAKLPTETSELYAICTALASKVTEQNLSRMGTIASRLNDASKGEFAVLLLRDCIRRNEKLQHTRAFIDIACTPVGKLLSGGE